MPSVKDSVLELVLNFALSMKVLRPLFLSLALFGSAALAQAGTYTVKAGDTLSAIAQTYRMDVMELMRSNNLTSTTIEIGQVLRVTGTPAAANRAPNVAATNARTTVNVRQAAMNLLGIPYRLGSATNRALDCSAYTQLVFRNIGVQLPRTAAEQWRVGRPVSRGNLQVGDLVFFNTMGRGVSHVGIYIGSGQFANANSYHARTVVDSFSNPYWSSRFMGGRRVL